MNSRVLSRGMAMCITLALTACAATPKQEASILDAMAARSVSAPVSCAAMNAATICVKQTRLGKDKNCGCLDRQAIADGNPLAGF